MDEVALARFYRALNNPDRFPMERELCDAAIGAKVELNMLRNPYGAQHYCPIHHAWFGSITDTIPVTICPLCLTYDELKAQPAPRTYEVSRAMATIECYRSEKQK